MESRAGITPAQMARGVVRCQVVDARTRRVVKDYDPQKNLILNQGLDMIAVRSWANCFLKCAAGTGTRATQTDPAPTLLSQTGTVLQLTGGSFVFTDTMTDAGKVIKWVSGQEAMIVSVDSPTQARAADAKTIFAKSFKVFLTQQTGLQTETGRSGTYFTGESGCGTTLSAGTGTGTLRRSFDFPTQMGSPITYKEVGFSNTASAGANLFSRVLLTVPVLVNPGQLLRVIYDLSITASPFVPVSRNANISGWVASGSDVLETWGLMGVNGVGATVAIQTYASVIDVNGNEPSADTWVLLGSDTTAVQAFGSDPVNRFVTGDSLRQLVIDDYIPLTFVRTKSIIFLRTDAVKTTLRTLALGNQNTSTDIACFYVFRFSANQSKDVAHELSLAFKFTWGRIIDYF